MKVAEVDFSSLNADELRGMLLRLITKAKNKAQLIRIIERVEEVIEDETEDAEIFWNRFTPEQRKELEKSFEESYNPENWISHDDMRKKHAKWLKE